MNILFFITQALLFMVPILMSVAFLTLIERKMLGYMQLRKGPKIVGPYGTLQPIADALKLFIKETLKPSTASPMLFFMAPALFLTLALLLWSVIPTPKSVIKVKLSLLLMLSLSSLSVYALLGSGWASKSKYSLLGSIRAVAQTISYEMAIGLILLSLLIWSGSFSLSNFMETQNISWFMIPYFPLSIMWFVSTLAETNRAPFDLTEGESELVSGYNVEYGGGPFALFFMAEYAKIIFMNMLSSIIFLGGTLPFKNIKIINNLTLTLKTMFLVSCFLWMRASFPRFRYDQLMHLTWKNFLPLTLGILSFSILMIITLKGMPKMI